MGARLSRIQSVSRQSTPGSKRVSAANEEVRNGKHVGEHRDASLDSPSGLSDVSLNEGKRVTAHVTPNASKRDSSEDWARLLNSFSGSISSQTWEGTVGVRTAAARDPKMHAAERSAAYREKQPKRTLPGQSEPQMDFSVPDLDRLGGDGQSPTGQGSLRALAEVSEAVDNAAKATTQLRRGRLTQNQVLDIFRLRRENSAVWNPDRLAQQYEVDINDMRCLIAFSRTVLPVQVAGTSRGLSDPQRKIERFEDVGNGTSKSP